MPIEEFIRALVCSIWPPHRNILKVVQFVSVSHQLVLQTLAPYLYMIGLSGMIAPLINLISGRTESLKKQLQVERNEKNLAKVSYLYEDDYYTKNLKINPDLIKAFQFFVVDDKKLVGYLKSKNKSLIKFRMVELAQEFNKLQKS